MTSLSEIIGSLGAIRYREQDQASFQNGILSRDWAAKYPDLFDQQDLAQTIGQPNRHFFEWLTAIAIYEASGWRSLYGLYEFKAHERKHTLFTRIASPPVLAQLPREARIPGAEKKCQFPDLFVYAPDESAWGFIEVKGPRDQLSKPQLAFFNQLHASAGVEVYVAENYVSIGERSHNTTV